MFGEFSPRVRGATSLGRVPAGTIIDWWQQDANTPVPAGWAQCNGQIACWRTGPRAGESFTTPNLIGLYVVGGDVLGGSSTGNANGFGNLPAQEYCGAVVHVHEYVINEGVVIEGTYGYAGIGLYGYYDTYAASSAPAAQVITKLIKL